MKKTLICLLVCFSLAGCATWGQMENGNNAIKGQFIETAFDVLGYPSGKQKVENGTVYFWSVFSTRSILIPQPVTTYGFKGTTSLFGTTSYNPYVPVLDNCLINMITYHNGRIKTWETQGNHEECQHAIERLNKYYKQQNI